MIGMTLHKIDWTQQMKEKTRLWRRQNAVERVEKPSRLSRARSLGYRAKQGFCVVRVKINKGGRKRPKIRKGRKPTNIGRSFFTTAHSKRAIAEKRAIRKYPNMEVLNSYYCGEDGNHKYFEVILVDSKHPSILSDKKIAWISAQRRRAFRGLTSAGKKSRGLG